ncbi:hypothetical protein PY254_05820 [Rhodanobacter sp. AS-Z3]|uniref:hypothetical protein n=1 Tax=Rhodanobacter sp. AS-Z3 TaxID=3031330 RepID=UPI002478D307|nr:hypothetical protein [Rhodanobacter sp. AS-Z3]WEN16184.1 hypothetical protein PY254_05820 [Rhodanobacter sp. AS-Z3]
MTRRRWPAWRDLWAGPVWMALLAALPWWLGLPSLLALAALLMLLQHRLTDGHARLIRRALRWGLPGMLFALQRSLGGDVIACGAALLGALSGYTLLAGLEAWLDRELRRAPAAPSLPEWPELAMAPSGPPARIIELHAVHWQSVSEALSDPLGGTLFYNDGVCQFATGEHIDGVGAAITFSPFGRWFVARLRDPHDLLLWDRQRERRHRLHGWHLVGWDAEQPWLSRGDETVPQALSAALGEDVDAG